MACSRTRGCGSLRLLCSALDARFTLHLSIFLSPVSCPPLPAMVCAENGLGWQERTSIDLFFECQLEAASCSVDMCNSSPSSNPSVFIHPGPARSRKRNQSAKNGAELNGIAAASCIQGTRIKIMKRCLRKRVILFVRQEIGGTKVKIGRVNNNGAAWRVGAEEGTDLEANFLALRRGYPHPPPRR